MESEIDFKFQKCGYCRYFQPCGKYDEGASAADVERGRCRRYPPKVDMSYYPYFLKHFMHIMENLAQVEHSGEIWHDSDTDLHDMLKTCSIQPYVQMDDFCGEFKPANVIQVKNIVDLFEGYDLSTNKISEMIEYLKRSGKGKSKKFRLS
ncbi:MAG: hypothetical protein ABIK15_00990 [Pseudomonadota bacterium]